ncbi:MAG: Crp/Fnr family transcriptional regulator [Bilifractor sp.]|nr:Crp/Fnr family transcriptional regulator [Lachnospiraceae bacterium]MDY2838562.1 Crp/Fnr family transcriptional regulator [Bilifractor sp.]
MERIPDSLRSACITIMKKSYLFRHLPDEDLQLLLDSPFLRVQSYQKGDLIFDESDKPSEIMLLIRGNLLIAQNTLSGKRMILSRIVDPGDTFGEVYVFKQLPAYDMYAETIERTSILFVDASLLSGESRDPYLKIAEIMMRNQLMMFASKAYMMNRRLRILGSPSIREKIARLLIERQGKTNRVHVMPREEMADYLNVTRPSLSREISAMVKEGIIRNEGQTLVILDQKKLEEYI